MTAANVTLTVPSDVELPADLFNGDVDYHEGWRFDTIAEAHIFAQAAMASHPGVVVNYTVTPVKCAHPGGSRTDDGRWECSTCHHIFDSYDAWAASSPENMASAAAVHAAIAADLEEMGLA